MSSTQEERSNVAQPTIGNPTNPIIRNDQNQQQIIQQRNPFEDPTDPYYLHHGNNPGNVLISQLLTGQDNYMSWSRAMQLAISVKNKLGFLDGTIFKPRPSDSVMYNVWLRNNNIVISWILNSVSKEISSSILYDEYVAAIWIDPKIHSQQRNGPHIYNLRK
uniref:Retrotransposon Copia-like N-terminal domain-containing protein n=1 Tax=Cannabis sativa TaxID=3483 RepID=A0A803PMI4_CANSA